MIFDKHVTITIEVSGLVVADTPDFTEEDARAVMFQDAQDAIEDAGWHIKLSSAPDELRLCQVAIARLIALLGVYETDLSDAEDRAKL